VLGIAARRVGWMAPSICVFADSASLAYAMTLAVGGGPSAQEGDRSRRLGRASGGSCESLSVGQQYVGLNTLILAEAITSCTD
jgi:hypothetical protein